MKQNIVTTGMSLALAFTLVGCAGHTPTVVKLDPTGPNVRKQTVGDLTLHVEEYAADGKGEKAFEYDLAVQEVLPLLIAVTNSGKASYEVKSDYFVVRGQSILKRLDSEVAAKKLHESVAAAAAGGMLGSLVLLPLGPLIAAGAAASTSSQNKRITEVLATKKFKEGVILPHNNREGFLYFELYKDRKDLSNLVIELTARNTVTGRTLVISALVPPVSLKRKPKCEGEDDDPPECYSPEETPVASAPSPQPKVTSTPPEVSPAPPEVTSTAPAVTPAPREVSVAPTKAAPAPSAEQLSMEKRLQKLMELRQKNLITNEEYQKAKKKVLKKLTE